VRGEDSVRLAGSALELGYDGPVVGPDLDIEIPDGSFTVIVGPNACGKSTLLRAMARVLKPRAGAVLLDGKELARWRGKDAARVLAMLPQDPHAPDSILVRDLVSRGRYPHQTLLRQWSGEDEAAVAAALAATHTEDLADCTVDELSGGQRQRVWLAMALAQETPLLLLDEPTTFLDIAHQLDILELCADLHEQGRTVLAVLHDLNQACRYATHLIVMGEGRIVAAGEPDSILDEGLVEDVFGVACRLIADPETGTPMIVPRARRPGAKGR